MDIIGFLAGLAGAFVLATRFPGALALGRNGFIRADRSLRVWAGHAAANVGRLMLLTFAVVFLVCGVVTVNAASTIVAILTAGPRFALVGVLLGGLGWLGISFIRLWPTRYARIGDVWNLGMQGGMTMEEFEAEYGPWQPAPLSITFWPILVSGLTLAATCLWIKWQAVAVGVGEGVLLPIRMVGGGIFSFTLGLVLGLPLAAIGLIAKHSDRFVDPVGISLLRAAMIFLPGVTEESFDRLTEGGTTLNVPMEEIMPFIKEKLAPPVAVVVTVFFFALWVANGLTTAYLITLIGAAVAASFCLWAFGAKKTDIAVKVISVMWGLILLAIVWSFLKDAGAVAAGTTAAEAHRGWFETQWATLRESLARDVALGSRGLGGVVRGIVRGILALFGGLILIAVAGTAASAKGVMKAVGTPVSLAALLAALACFAHVIAVIYGWFAAC